MPSSKPHRGILGWRGLRLGRTSLVVFAVLATLGLLLAVGCSGDPEPTATPVPPTAEVATGAEEPELTVEELLSVIERRIEAFRGIDTPPPIEHSFVDQQALQELLAEELADPETVEQLIHESALLRLIGAIPQDADLGAIYESMLGSQVLGIYDPEKEQFFVLDDSGLGSDSPASALDTEAQLTYAHEYVHRLQDAEFDLENIDERASGDDMALAIAALVEGDATHAQSQYMFQNFDFLEIANLLDSVLAGQADTPEAPPFLQRSLEFPYVEGAAFVGELVGSGGITAVDDAFNDLPKSTEQVLHFGKYVNDEAPIELDVPDDAPGVGWSVQGENVLGEFFLRTWLQTLGSDKAEAAAAGWGGDAYAVFESGSGESALGVVTAWDSDADAREFITELSASMSENASYESRSGGLPGVLEAWEGPGGYMVMSRWDSGDTGDMVAVAISPEGGLSHMINQALAAN